MRFEDSWLFRCLQAMGGDAETEDLRWDEIRRLSLLPVMSTWRQKRGDELPAEVEAARQRYLRRKMFLRILTVELVEKLSSKMAVIVEKGEPLGEELFPDPAMRASGDIDLLVLPGDLEAAAQILEEMGYVAKRELTPQLIQTNKQWVFVHEGHGAVVELHWQLLLPALPPVPLGELFDSQRSLVWSAGTPAPVLREDWLLLYLAIHFFSHSGYARGLVDIAAWLDRFGEQVDLKALSERCRALGVYGILQWPIHVLWRLTGVMPGPCEPDVDWTVKIWSGVGAKALRGCMVRENRSVVERHLQQITSDLGSGAKVMTQCLLAAMVDGKRKKIRHVMQPLFFGPHRYGRRLVGWRR